MNDREVAMAGVSQNILRAFVREALVTLSEEAVAPSAAVGMGLALLDVTRGTHESYVLYDAGKAVAALHDLSGETMTVTSRALHAASAVVGMLNVKKDAQCGGARVVSSVAADKGFGPLLYDIAMSSGPLASDRHSVSLSAERVWQRYYMRSDVTKTPIEGRCRKHVRVRPWLNFAYSLSAPVDVSRLRAAHEAVVDTLGGFSRADVVGALRSAADRFFDDRYVEA